MMGGINSFKSPSLPGWRCQGRLMTPWPSAGAQLWSVNHSYRTDIRLTLWSQLVSFRVPVGKYSPYKTAGVSGANCQCQQGPGDAHWVSGLMGAGRKSQWIMLSALQQVLAGQTSAINPQPANSAINKQINCKKLKSEKSQAAFELCTGL